ncbi:MAG: protease modulator HflC [Deltaproteobacteria bacterium]|nr:MAG: protease modulator HflC [Deltaproteobacteria bacterium]
MKTPTLVATGAALVCAVAASSLWVLDAREVALVTSFGAPVREVTEPGLHVHAPWPIHQVLRFDRRARVLAIEPTEMLTTDKKNLVVEAFVVWRVARPQTFLESVATAETAEARLSDLVVSAVAAGLGHQQYDDLFNVVEDGEPTVPLLPPSVLEQVAAVALERFGVEVQDLRVRHLGLPMQNEQSIYGRMRAERARIANKYRSEGEEQAAAIRARADRQAAELVAGAEREAGAVTAKAEQAAARLQAEAYRKDPQLYRLLRRLETAEAILDEDATLVLDSESPLLSGLQEPTP